MFWNQNIQDIAFKQAQWLAVDQEFKARVVAYKKEQFKETKVLNISGGYSMS